MNDFRARTGERGAILVLTLITAVLIAGFTYAFLVVSRAEIQGAKSDVKHEKALQAAEAGIDDALDRLNHGDTPAVERSPAGGGIGYRVDAEDKGSTADGNRMFLLTSRAQVPGGDRTVEVIVENQSLAVRERSAITTNGPVGLAGNVIVDGRDYDASGFGVIGPGVFGVSSSQFVTSSGSAEVGGNGHAPMPNATAVDDVFMQSVQYGNTVDDDADGAVDEEAFDGNDNDGDTRVDEDLAPFRSTPDSLFGTPEGTLKRVAQGRGTYFETESAFADYLAQNGGEIPGGQVIVLDYPATSMSGPVWTPANFGPEMNEEPSILVFHSEFSNALMKDFQGRFKGFILTDNVTHVNGEARILGGVYLFGQSEIGNEYGSGNADILYSSAVLTNLPLIPFFAQRAWREVAAGG